MTFDNFVAENEGANAAAVALKVSLGDEIRRATLNASSFAALSEVVAKLFALEQASLVLKYQDDDGDKITMSTDAELQAAIQLSKETKTVLRLFVEAKPVEVKQVQVEPAEVKAPTAEEMPARRGPFPHGPLQHGPFHHGHGHAPFHPFYPTRPYGGYAHAHGVHTHYAPPVFAHGTFSPVGSDLPRDPLASKHELKQERKAAKHAFKHAFKHELKHERKAFKEGKCGFKHEMKEGKCAFKHEMKEARHEVKQERDTFKERRRAMKETIRAMKETASTPEEKEAIKKLKEEMKAEFKDAWKGFKQCQKNPNRLMAKHVADVTIPDNSELPADTPVIKTWRLQNPGTVEWPAASQLLFVSHRGDNLNGPERVVVEGPVLPAQEVEVSVPFITPNQPGRYVAYYRMATPDGSKFGQRLWVSFVIAPPAPAPAPATATSTAGAATPDAVMAAAEMMD